MWTELTLTHNFPVPSSSHFWRSLVVFPVLRDHKLTLYLSLKLPLPTATPPADFNRILLVAWCCPWNEKCLVPGIFTNILNANIGSSTVMIMWFKIWTLAIADRDRELISNKVPGIEGHDTMTSQHGTGISQYHWKKLFLIYKRKKERKISRIGEHIREDTFRLEQSRDYSFYG